MAQSVLVIGGGLAGLSTATALAERGFAVTVLESRTRLGGRAGSFTDSATGQVIDACQHVSMGCCTNLVYFFRTVGAGHLLRPEPVLYFMTPDRRISRMQAGPWPAPFHLTRSFLGAHYLTATEKLRIAFGLGCLRQTAADADPPFLDWLMRHAQTERTVQRFWGLVLTSALNESPERVGLRYARKVFCDAFLGHPRGFEVSVPTVPLDRLYGSELRTWLERHSVRVRLNHAVKAIRVAAGRVQALELRNGEGLTADWYVSSVPFDRLGDLLSAEVIEAHDAFRNVARLETSPLTSVHLWFDRAVTSLPHAALVGCLGQWVFNRGMVAPSEHYLQVVISASRQFQGLRHEEIQNLILAEVSRLFPAARTASLLRARVVTEHKATFSALPGVDRWRPPQTTPIANLFLAGDWTATGWPATMEGAVRSGYLAAEALLLRLGRWERCVQPDLMHL